MIKILVVDDSPFISNQIQEMVEEKEYEVVGHATTGEEGVCLYKKLNPDIVTMDIVMPGIDGITAAETILKEDPNARIIMLSSLCDVGTLEEIKSKGMKWLLPKPLEKELLLATLELVQNKQKKDL